MRREQLNELHEDELAILWYCINKIEPPVLAGVDLDPSVFPSINHKKLMARLANARPKVIEEHLPLFDGLVAKLGVS